MKLADEKNLEVAGEVGGLWVIIKLRSVRYDNECS